MPELPEVETIARGLREKLRNARIARVRVARADYVVAPPPSPSAHLVGKAVRDVGRHGKRLHLKLAPAGEIVLHLGMSGQITLQPVGDPVAPHTHLRIQLDGDREEIRVRDPRRFGGVWIRGAAGETGRSRRAHRPRGPGTLGPDALAIRLPAFRRLLARRRQIKALLLDQRAIAGLGNIYCDEALWATSLHPLTPASDITDDSARELLRELRRLLRQAIRHGGSTLRDYRTADGAEGSFQRRHRVYGREDEPCLRCHDPIVRILTAGRSSHLCPTCQPPPRR